MLCRSVHIWANTHVSEQFKQKGKSIFDIHVLYSEDWVYCLNFLGNFYFDT